MIDFQDDDVIIRGKNTKTTFFEKKPRECPFCLTEFYHEGLLTGNARIIAGPLRDDLRRIYEKSNKYGKVYPLIYVVTVCPKCLYASFSEDFLFADTSRADEVLSEQYNRRRYIEDFFGHDIDFTKNRDLLTGAASYFLAMSGYYWHTKDVFPTLKKALSSLRLSWTLEDLATERPNDNYDKLIPFFQYKASELYTKAIGMMQTGEEIHDKVKSFGPDIDNNFGYEGMLYMGACLALSSSIFMPDKAVRLTVLEDAKMKISRVFGSGKSSKSKPGPLLDKIRDLRVSIINEIETLKS